MFEHYSVADLFANLYKKRKVNLLALLVLFALIAVPFTLKAVKNKNVYITTGFCAGGLGKLIGVVYTAKWLYPEEMKDINPDKVFDEWMAMQGVKTPKGHVYKLK